MNKIKRAYMRWRAARQLKRFIADVEKANEMLSDDAIDTREPAYSAGWRKEPAGYLTCTQCGDFHVMPDEAGRFFYCPVCGAKMRRFEMEVMDDEQ